MGLLLIRSSGGGNPDPEPDTAPAYIAALSPYEVLELASTSSGNVSMQDVTPAEWDGSAGANNLDAVVVSYSGGGKAVTGTILSVHGGGHNDGANNGMYLYEFAGTTQPFGWKSPLVISDLDQITVSSTTYSDGKPASIHTYDHMVTIGDYVYRFRGSRWEDGSDGYLPWRYSLQNDTWEELATGGPSAGFHILSTIADQATEKVLCSWESAITYFYRAAADTWSSAKTLGFHIGEYNIGIRGPDSECLIVGEGAKRVVTVDFSAETVSSAAFVSSGDDEILDADGISGFYDPTLDCYWLFGGAAANTDGYANLYHVNRSTWAVTAHALTGDAISIMPGTIRSSGRFLFMDEYRAIGFVTTVDGPAYVIRLPSE